MVGTRGSTKLPEAAGNSLFSQLQDIEAHAKVTEGEAANEHEEGNLVFTIPTPPSSVASDEEEEPYYALPVQDEEEDDDVHEYNVVLKSAFPTPPSNTQLEGAELLLQFGTHQVQNPQVQEWTPPHQLNFAMDHSAEAVLEGR